LWNTNSYMTEGNETPIGALRADGTEKPEATVMRNFAKFAAALAPHLRNPQPAQVAVIASQAAQYSAIGDSQIEAQRKSVRALAYYDHLTPYLIYENQIEKMGSPKLAILPSAQALGEDAWQQLLKYVDRGGNLLITGPVDRDEHWQRINRAAQFIPGSTTWPLTFHNAIQFLSVNPESIIPLSFDQQSQTWFETAQLGDGSTSYQEIVHGKGRIIWTAWPIELAQRDEAAGEFYRYVMGELGINPLFEATALSPGIMCYPIPLENSVLYVIVSDNAETEHVELRDRTTGAELNFLLPGEHAALALVGKKEKAVIAKYGF
jgi:hypothetical protein